MRLIIIFFLIIFQQHPLLGFSDPHLHNHNDSFQNVRDQVDNFSNSENQQRVYICTGQYAYAYHSRPDCPGLNNCKGDILYTDNYTATYKLNRIPCCRCWLNVTGNCCDDNPYNQKLSSNQYSPYVPQLPVYAMVYVALQKQREYDLRQQQLHELADALEVYFSPEQVAIRKENREIREKDRQTRENNREIKELNQETEKYRKARLKNKKTKNKNDDYKYLTTLAVEFNEAPLRKAPRTKSEIIYTCSSNSMFLVLKTNHKHYCKVSVGKHVGYIAKVYLLRKD